MLNIMKMNAVGLDGKTPIMNFEFTFNNSTELPKGPGYQLGQRIYVIEEGSIAINNSTNIIYKYSSGKWIKTPNKSTSTTNTITENGSYTIASNIATGTGNIDVNVIGGGVTLIDKTITENGEYNAVDDNVYGYSSVNVDVEPNLINKPITKNGVYTAITDNVDGYSSVNVNVSSVGFNTIHTMFPGGDGVSSEMWLFDAPDGNYVISNIGTPNSVYVTCKTPVKRLTITNAAVDQIVFTTDSAFEGCFVNGVESTYSDNIFSVAGSGYASYVQIYDDSSYCFTPNNPVDDEDFYETFYFNMT